jgi:hypothetical protein
MGFQQQASGIRLWARFKELNRACDRPSNAKGADFSCPTTLRLLYMQLLYVGRIILCCVACCVLRVACCVLRCMECVALLCCAGCVALRTRQHAALFGNEQNEQNEQDAHNEQGG